MVSNLEESDLSMALEVHGLRSHFDFVLTSDAAGSCKPHERIFQQLILISRRCAYPSFPRLFGARAFGFAGGVRRTYPRAEFPQELKLAP